MFNIFEKIEQEIFDFDKGGVYIVGKPDNVKTEMPTRRGERGGYYYSQRDLLTSIDLACASKYRKGIWDDEGQRKTFINIVNFFRDVMKMKIKISVADYLFSPTSLDYTWIVWLFDRMFKLWASEESYNDQIDEYAHDLATYGTCVGKRLNDCTERVPLRTMRCTQTAKSLYRAAAYGGYVILEDEKHYNEMQNYPDWDLSRLSSDKSYPVMERYGLVPQGLIDGWGYMSDEQISRYVVKEDEEYVLAMAIVVPEGANAKGAAGADEALLYLQELDENSWPLDECHAEKVDGRWLGRGEVEKQLENQIARNLNANYRRRSILWAAKKIFQSSDENIQENLVYEVVDGQILHPKQNGLITQVNTQSQHTTEIKGDDDSWDANSKQNSFAFEVATGQSMPSGTPFRLGIVLDRAVSSHFKLVRSTFSNFLKRSFFNQLIPLFQEEYADEHDAQIAISSSDIDAFKEDIVNFHTNSRIFEAMLNGERPSPSEIRLQVEQELVKNAYAFIAVPKNGYDNIQKYMKLNLTDDISAEVADLTTLYQVMSQKGDARAEHVLREIFALRGKALPAIVGAALPAPKPEAPAAPASPLAPAPVPETVAA